MKKIYISVKEEVVTQIVEFVTATGSLLKFLSLKITFPSVREKMEMRSFGFRNLLFLGTGWD
jgi:hypothetical protein